MSPWTALQLYIIGVLTLILVIGSVLDHPEWFKDLQTNMQYTNEVAPYHGE